MYAPVVALFCTPGSEAFLANSIQGLVKVGVPPSRIFLGYPADSADTLTSRLGDLSSGITIVPSDQTLPTNTMVNYGQTSLSKFAGARLISSRRCCNRITMSSMRNRCRMDTQSPALFVRGCDTLSSGFANRGPTAFPTGFLLGLCVTGEKHRDNAVTRQHDCRRPRPRPHRAPSR